MANTMIVYKHCIKRIGQCEFSESLLVIDLDEGRACGTL